MPERLLYDCGSAGTAEHARSAPRIHHLLKSTASLWIVQSMCADLVVHVAWQAVREAKGYHLCHGTGIEMRQITAMVPGPVP
ncbi:MAG TPA: hypothetical protein VF835_04230 [Rhizomicrobium sp.]